MTLKDYDFESKAVLTSQVNLQDNYSMYKFSKWCQVLDPSNTPILELEDSEKCLGTLLGDYVDIAFLEGETLPQKSDYRAYMPISRVDNQGDFDVLMKNVQYNQEGKPGLFTSRMLNVTPGQEFSIIRRQGSWQYKGYGEFLLGKNNNPESQSEPVGSRNVKYLVMFAEDSGITNFFSLIETISQFQYDEISITLIYSVDNIVSFQKFIFLYRRGANLQDDLVFETELINLLEEGRLNLKILMKNPPNGWPFLRGAVNRSIVENETPIFGKLGFFGI